MKSLSKSGLFLTFAASCSIAISSLWASASIAQTAPSIRPSGGVSQNAPLQVKPRTPESEEIYLRAGELPEVTMTSSVMFRILASEFSAQRGVFLPAGKTMLDLAREVGDVRLAKRSLEFYLAGGNLAGALDASRVWVRLAPDNAEAASTEMALAAAAGQTSGLATALRKQIDAAQDKKGAIANALSVLSRMPDRREALVILDQAINESTAKNMLAAHLALADVAQGAGDEKRAVAEAKAGLAVSPRSEDAAMRVFEYGLGVDADQAVRDARNFISAHPGARRVRLLLTGYLADKQQFDAALAELASMLKRFPEDFDLMYMQAQVLYRAKRLDQAQAMLEQFVSVQTQRMNANPAGATDAAAALAEAYSLLARIAQDQGRLDDAFKYLSQIEDPAARHPARIRQAFIRLKQNRFDDALAIIDSAGPETDEEYQANVLSAAQVLRDANRIDEAIRRLRVADNKQPDSVEIKYELAMLYERQNKIKDAERLLREIIALDPGHAHAHNALGYSLADRNQRLPEALKLIQRAHEILPKDPFIMDSLGWVKFRMGDRKAAIEYLTKAYAIRPEADIGAHLGEVYWVQGDREQALKYFKEASSKDPKNPTLIETLKRLGVKI
ncbi:tetratricopeptide repeat protein [Orrella sp. NBD-18]|uniref:Tetratricopeptide repeat protein n=1 Tax=Sheuella amnicola TaxID=2707330 RepID=A0A6B2QZ30_9BURK|nr:tetratricopeptide repeat protein [Sheuella amnicola]NDY83291.1 tetratricopeptide repeat protein [Sheuella amnicola]